MGEISLGLSFDDVLLVPQMSEILPVDTDLSTKVAAGIRLNIPVLSSAMDTVTEAELAIALAREGGLGVIHRNNPIEVQADMVARVKRSENMVISDPFTVSASTTLEELRRVMEGKGVNGFPVVDEMGTYRRALVENVYQVEKVISGPLPKDTSRIIVNQWVVMDRKTLPSATHLKPGLTSTLTLEAMSDHPELSSEFRSSDHSEFNAPLFYDVNSHR